LHSSALGLQGERTSRVLAGATLQTTGMGMPDYVGRREPAARASSDVILISRQKRGRMHGSDRSR
jgi:hypothetical protein